MSGFISTATYKVIYIYAILDDAHNGLLKIGEASLASTKSYAQLLPDCAELNDAARKRIDQQTHTAGISYQLLYTQVAVKVIQGAVTCLGTGADKDVHKVLKASGIHMVCPNGVSSDEWFKVDLPTAKNAIKAALEGRPTLTAGEITPPDLVIHFREEQLDAITKTQERFKHHHDMLWNAKMRYGKTLTALELVRRMRLRRVIILTHRPVVGSGWQEDFKKIFRGDDGDYTFLFKNKNGEVDDSDPAIDSGNDSDLRARDAMNQYFIYFASIQDLRGSALVGGSFDKNKAVFEMNWDLIINDEAHEGTQTELGQDVLKKLRKPKTKVLSLSGTPFNIIGQYDEDAIYTWDYIMEQSAKAEWEKKHPGEPNPYADLPMMHVFTYDLGELYGDYKEYDIKGKGFNFREFFRTWTGDRRVDGKDMPEGAKVGDLVHEADVRSFLNLITTENAENNYPFATEEYRDMFRHTLWMVPGVKEARALSALLQEHPVFSHFKVANVAGDGDWEAPYEDALKTVRDAIKDNDYTITLSCGKLTTGVTVKEWTAVFVLSGSQSTSASGYLQTIFRAQSPGSINGKRKEHCYVFDFAPDRSLKVFAEAMKASSSVRTQNDQYEVFKQFLNFCPIVAVNGTQMKSYDVTGMMGQIKRIQVEHAIRNGFDDNSIYDGKLLLTLDKDDLKQFGDLKAIVGSHPAQPSTGSVDINSQGFTDEQYGKTKGELKKKGRDLTPEEKKQLEAEKKAKENRKSAVSILRAISIRLPLLIYGADVPFDLDINIEDFVEMVDSESWREFMPQGVTKAIFKRFTKYYDRDVFVTAGREIRRMALAADSLSPTRRVMKIAEIFSYFKNPDKETVLTPWRVVNMHLSDTIGGWCFYDEAFEEDTPKEKKRLAEPRFVDRGEVTATIFGKNSRILEINSKSGLYPLYVAYSLYRQRLGGLLEDYLTPKAQKCLWEEVLWDNVFVVCKTPMAQLITRRTLVGYTNVPVNARYIKNLITILRESPGKFIRDVAKPAGWSKEGEPLKFSAVVGNPPYQEMDGGNGASATPVYNLFIEQAKAISPQYISMISPSRWFSGGKNLDEFRDSMLHDDRIRCIHDYVDNEMLFRGVLIVGGVNYFLWDSGYHGKCDFYSHKSNGTTMLPRDLQQYSILVRNNESASLIQRLDAHTDVKLSSAVSARNVFGIPTDEKGVSDADEQHPIKLFCSQKSNSTVVRYISKDVIQKQSEILDRYKVIIGRVVPRGGEVGVDAARGYRAITTVQVIPPNAVFTDTYLMLASFATRVEAENFAKYMILKFPRFLLHETFSSLNITRESFRFVPFLDYNREWSDADLYARYECTDDEIAMIEKMIRPLEYVVHE